VSKPPSSAQLLTTTALALRVADERFAAVRGSAIFPVSCAID